jgi:hypothetical protein
LLSLLGLLSMDALDATGRQPHDLPGQVIGFLTSLILLAEMGADSIAYLS